MVDCPLPLSSYIGRESWRCGWRQWVAMFPFLLVIDCPATFLTFLPFLPPMWPRDWEWSRGRRWMMGHMDANGESPRRMGSRSFERVAVERVSSHVSLFSADHGLLSSLLHRPWELEFRGSKVDGGWRRWRMDVDVYGESKSFRQREWVVCLLAFAGRIMSLSTPPGAIVVCLSQCRDVIFKDDTRRMRSLGAPVFCSVLRWE